MAAWAASSSDVPGNNSPYRVTVFCLRPINISVSVLIYFGGGSHGLNYDRQEKSDIKSKTTQRRRGPASRRGARAEQGSDPQPHCDRRIEPLPDEGLRGHDDQGDFAQGWHRRGHRLQLLQDEGRY